MKRLTLVGDNFHYLLEISLCRRRVSKAIPENLSFEQQGIGKIRVLIENVVHSAEGPAKLLLPFLVSRLIQRTGKLFTETSTSPAHAVELYVGKRSANLI